MHQGCGIQLTYKIVKDSGILAAQKPEPGAKGKAAKPTVAPMVFISPSVANHFLESANYAKISDPASAIPKSVVISDVDSALEHESALHQAKDILYICVNTSGKQQLAKRMGIANWSATASVAFYDDMVAKLQKAAKMTGVRFIEILTPCPKIWKSEPSNTVEIARQAVEISLWPLFELDHGHFSLTYKPAKLAGIESLTGLQKLIVPDKSALEKSWRLTSIGKPFEAEI